MERAKWKTFEEKKAKKVKKWKTLPPCNPFMCFMCVPVQSEESAANVDDWLMDYNLRIFHPLSTLDSSSNLDSSLKPLAI